MFKNNPVLVWLVLGFAFFLDGKFTIYFPYTINEQVIFALPAFTLVSISILMPYVFKKSSMYFPILVFGLLYDIVYTSQIGVYVLIFPISLFFLIFIFHFLNDNFINLILITINILLLKEIIVFMMYYLSNAVEAINLNLIYNRFISSLSLNIIYVIILYIVLKILDRKFKFRF